MSTDRRVWKFALPTDDIAHVRMPKGAQVLSVAAHPGATIENTHLTMWALVDPTADTVDRMFRVAGTRQPIGTDVGRYIGTAALGDWSFHVFEMLGGDR